MNPDFERQLKDTQAELRRVRNEYQDFAYIVSHDLSSTLRQIEGFAKIVSSNNAESFDDETKRHLSLILDGAEKSTNIIEALLGYSHLDTSVTSFTSVDCNVVVANVLQNLLPIIDARNAKVEYTELPQIIAHEDSLMRVFHNLISNALIYGSPDRPPLIYIDASPASGLWQFSIKDNGMGIRANQTDKIFSVLRRGVGKSHDEEDGQERLGMGLAVAKKILEQHGGTISVNSDLGHGTTFTFTISQNLQAKADG